MSDPHSTHPVYVFFYGSYINRDVLAEVDLTPDRLSVARLPGYELRIRPLANIVPASHAVTYGIICLAHHDALVRLYQHAEHVLGGVYLPEAVLVETDLGDDTPPAYRPALTYIAHHLPDAQADNDYVSRISVPGRAYGFPDWYIDHIESFKT